MIASEITLLAKPKAPWRVRLNGGSMEPSVHDGEQMLVVPASRRPKLGEVIVFAERDRIVAHRVIGYERAGVVTAGDASRGRREVVPSQLILGIAQCVLPADGSRRRELRSAFGAVVLRLRLALMFHLRARR